MQLAPPRPLGRTVVQPWRQRAVGGATRQRRVWMSAAAPSERDSTTPDAATSSVVEPALATVSDADAAGGPASPAAAATAELPPVAPLAASGGAPAASSAPAGAPSTPEATAAAVQATAAAPAAAAEAHTAATATAGAHTAATATAGAAPTATSPSSGNSRGSSEPARPYRMSLRSFLDFDDGPPRVMSLLDPTYAPAPTWETQPGTRRQHLPLLLYLPGIDGSGLAASRQFPSLLRKFDMRTFVTPPQDRTPFTELVQIVVEFLRQEVPACSPTRPVYVLGESFGGLLALAVAAEVPDLVDRLVLVNPATSFSSSLWPVIGPLLPQVPPELYRALPLALAPVLGNPFNLLAAGLDSSSGLSLQQQASQLIDTATNLLSQLPVLAEILPADTLAWKLELLRQGGEAVEPQLPRIQQRCFIMVGDQDLLIPSKEEGPRLQRALPRTQLRVEKGRSHALLQEGGVDLAAILEEEGFYVKERRMSAPIKKRSAAGFGVAVPIELPSPGELEGYAERTTSFGRRLSSPVFISTDGDGRRCLGLSNIPEGRPLLLVGNHQTLALDLGVLCEQFLREQGVLLRGLAHPVIFSQSFGGSGGNGGDSSSSSSNGNGSGQGEQASSSNGGAATSSSSSSSSGLPAWDPIPAFGNAFAGRSIFGGDSSSSGSSRAGGSSNTDGRSAFRDFMTTFGAVPVSAFNMHRLLANQEAVLLFPGGVREAYKRRGEDYQLFWPERSEFIRMAARFGATIVPFAGIGVDDSLNIIADNEQLSQMPFVGDMVRRRASNLPQARRGVSAASFEEENFVAPLAAPKLPPGRLYFVFQKPIHTSPEDLKDRERCDELYRATKASVEEGLAYLLANRQRDPYGEFLPRSLYEAAYRGRQAPTFPL